MPEDATTSSGDNPDVGDASFGTPAALSPPDAASFDDQFGAGEALPSPTLPIPEGVSEEPVPDTSVDDAVERSYEEARMPDANEKHHGYEEKPPRSFAERTLEEKPHLMSAESARNSDSPPAAPGQKVKRG